jgi:hypothetical protein
MKDTRTAWGKEFDAKREAWSEVDRLKKEIERLKANEKIADENFDSAVAENNRLGKILREQKKEIRQLKSTGKG